MISKLIVTLLFYGYVRAQQSDCNFLQEVTGASSSYWMQYPEYPRDYNRPRLCRWIGVCQNGYNCRVDCTLQMPSPPSPNACGQGERDRVLVSRSGDDSLTGAETYCGSTSFTAVSFQTRIVVGLQVPNNSPGGKFRCKLSSVVSTPNSNCRCGEKRTSRIVGGVTTGVNEYPMMAAVFANGNHMCGGVIVTPWYIATAAHCMFARNSQIPVSSLVVGVGNYNINNVTPYAVCTVVIHPNYNPQTFDFDIAMIRPCSRLQFSLNVGAVCLPFRYLNNDLVGQNVTITGWGTLDSGAPASLVLQKADVAVVPLRRCEAEYRDRNITQNRLCTFTPGKDSCQMDSGGPLLLTNPNSGLLFYVGIISFGDFCAEDRSSVNMRVTAVLNWILNVVGPQEVCVRDVN